MSEELFDVPNPNADEACPPSTIPWHNTPTTHKDIIIAKPANLVANKVKERLKYSNKLAKQLSDIGIKVDSETGLEMSACKEDKTTPCLTEEETLENWDPMKESYHQKNFNCYKEQKFDDNPIEKHVLMSSSDGHKKISPTKAGSEGVRLYISNIPISMTEEGLANLFGSVGKCYDVKRCRPQSNDSTFGFVTYGNVCDAEAAIAKYNGFVFGKKYTLRVKLAAVKTDHKSLKNEGMHEELIWGNEPKKDGENWETSEDAKAESKAEVTERDSKNTYTTALSNISQTTSNNNAATNNPLQPPTNNKFTHSTTNNILLANTATNLNGKDSTSQTTITTMPSLFPAKPPTTTPSPAARTPSASKPRLYIQGLPVGFPDVQLEILFGKIGPTSNGMVVGPKKPNQRTTYGFITYDKVEDADKAINHFHGYIHRGIKLEVSYSQKCTADGCHKKNEDEAFYDKLYDEPVFGDIDESMQEEESTVKPTIFQNEEVKTAFQTSKTNVCSFCQSPGAGNKCSKCKAHYCDRACQSKHWNVHKITCLKPTTFTHSSLAETVNYEHQIPDRPPSTGEMFLMFAQFGIEGSITGTLVCADQLHFTQDLVRIESVLKANFENCKTGNVQFNDVKPGLLVACKVTDIDWSRAVVLSAPTNQSSDCKINFIDSGLEKYAKLQELFHLPFECVLLPKQSAKFHVNGLNDTEIIDNEMLCNINELLIIEKVKVNCMENNSAVFNVDCLAESLNDFILRGLESKKMPPPSCSDAIRGMMLSDLSTKPFPDDHELTVSFTEIVTPKQMYGQVVSDNAVEVLGRLIETVNQHCESTSVSFTPKVNEICCAKFSLDGGWYRAVVLSYNADMTARVFFIDFGNKDDVDTTNIRSINEELLNIPCLANQFSLNVESVSGDNTWSDEALNFVAHSLADKMVTVKCESIVDQKMNCDIKLDDGTLLCQELLKKGFAIDKHNMIGDLPKAEYKQTECECIFVSVDSPTCLHGWPGDIATTNETVAKITARLAKLQQTGKPYKPIPKQVCAAFHEEYQEWYRVVVVSIGQSSVNVQLLDYGNKIDVPFDRICPLQDIELLKIAPLAVHMGLNDVPEEVWSETPISFIKEKLEFKKHNIIRVKIENERWLVNITGKEGEEPINIGQLFSEKFIIKVNEKTTLHRYTKSDFTVYRPESEEFTAVITHIESPSMFHGQLADEPTMNAITKMSTDLMTEFTTSSVNTKYAPNKDEVCAGLHSQYGDWYRVLVTSVSETNCVSKLVDYGDLCDIAVENIRPLPAQFTKLPFQAISMSLTGIEPLTPTWEEASNSKLQELILFKPVAVKCIDAFNELLSVEVQTDADIAKALVNYKLAKVVGADPKNLTQDRPTATEKPTPVSPKRLLYNEMSSKEYPTVKFPVLVVNVESPLNFHAQLADIDIIQQIQQVSQDMTQLFSEDTPVAMYSPVVGEVCAVFFSSDELFYRARIDSIVDSCITVTSIDYGNTITVEIANIKPLPQQYATLPAQAFFLSLHGLSKNSEFSVEAKKDFMDSCIYQKCDMIIKKRDGEHCEVEMSSDTVSSFLDYLNSKAYTRQATNTAPKTNIKPSPVSPKRLLYNEMPIKEYPTVKFSVLVVNVDSPLNFHAQLADIDIIQQIQQMSQDMTQLFSEDFTIYSPIVEEVCAVFFSSDELFYRARIDSIADNRVTVTSIDFGNTITVERDDIKPLPQQYATLPAQAFFLSLHGLPKNSEFNVEANKYFMDSCIYLKCDLIIKKMDGELCEVEMSSDNVSSFLNYLDSKGYVRQAVNAVSETNNQPTQAAPTPALISESKQQVAPSQSSIQETLKLPVRVEEFPESCQVVVRHIQSLDSFYVQVFTEEFARAFEMFDQINAIWVRDTTPKSHKPHVGEICCGLLDEWNRCRVVVVNETSATVYFVDVGVTSEVSFAQLRPIKKAFLELPPLAVEVSLHNPDRIVSNAAVLKEFSNRVLQKPGMAVFVKNGIKCPEVQLFDENGEDCIKVLTDLVRVAAKPALPVAETRVEAVEDLTQAVSSMSIANRVYARDVPLAATIPKPAQNANVKSEQVTPSPGTVTKKADSLPSDIKPKETDTTKEKVSTEEIVDDTPIERPSSARKCLPQGVHPLESVACKMSVASMPVSKAPVEIIITHVESPELSYGIVPTAAVLEQIESFSAELKEWIAANEDSSCLMKGGTLCCTKNNEGTWYRGVITQVNDETASVFCFDHGYTLTVQHNEIKALASDFKRYAAQAIPLKLMTVKPLNDAKDWSTEACDRYKELIDGETVRVLCKSRSGVVNLVKMRLKSDNSMLDKLLEEAGMAEVFQPVYDLPQHPKTTWSKKESIPFAIINEHVKFEKIPQKNFEGIVTCVVSPRLFYITLHDPSKIAAVDQIGDELTKLYDEDTNETHEFSAHTMCALKAADGYWYRGFILKIYTDNKFVVFLVDYGMKETISKDKIRPLPANHAAYPGQALTMQLQYTVPPKKATQYTEEGIQRFKSLVEGKLVNVEVLKTVGFCHRVIIEVIESGINVSNELIRMGFAEHVFGKDAVTRPQGRGMLRGAMHGSMHESRSPREVVHQQQPPPLMKPPPHLMRGGMRGGRGGSHPSYYQGGYPPYREDAPYYPPRDPYYDPYYRNKYYEEGYYDEYNHNDYYDYRIPPEHRRPYGPPPPHGGPGPQGRLGPYGPPPPHGGSGPNGPHHGRPRPYGTPRGGPRPHGPPQGRPGLNAPPPHERPAPYGPPPPHGPPAHHRYGDLPPPPPQEVDKEPPCPRGRGNDLQRALTQQRPGQNGLSIGRGRPPLRYDPQEDSNSDFHRGEYNEHGDYNTPGYPQYDEDVYHRPEGSLSPREQQRTPPRLQQHGGTTVPRSPNPAPERQYQPYHQQNEKHQDARPPLRSPQRGRGAYHHHQEAPRRDHYDSDRQYEPNGFGEHQQNGDYQDNQRNGYAQPQQNGYPQKNGFGRGMAMRGRGALRGATRY